MLQTPPAFQALINARTNADGLSFIFHGGRLLLNEQGPALPRVHELAALGMEGAEWHAVGLLGERYYQSTWRASDDIPAGYVWRSLRSLFGELDDGLLGMAGRAGQIAEWARTHRHCGACAAPMALVAGERCFKCNACGHLAYPRISPAMMVLIRKGDHVLLAYHTHSPAKRYTPLAGFLEAGESIEEAVHREVFEEVGLRVHKLRYFGSQSWPFPHSLMIAFTAEYLDGDIVIDANEISDARWFGPGDEWPARIAHISISSMLIDAHRP